jgi:hypothetical protein
LLSARAALPPGQALTVPPPAADPTAGHDTARVDVMLGRRNGHGVVQLQARPAYHELMDTEEGFQRGAAITFFSLALSKAANGQVQLEEFVPVEIASLSPREPLLEARSWRVHIGLERARQARASDGSRPLGANLQGGPGLSFELGASKTLLGYAFLDNQARWDRSLVKRPWAIGTGVATGLIGDITPAWRVQVEAFGRAYLQGQPAEVGLALRSRYSVDKAWNLNAQCDIGQRHGTRVNQSCLVGVQRYL